MGEGEGIAGYLRDVAEPDNYHEVFVGRTTIGRAEGNDIKITSRSVSSHHAEIEIDEKGRPPKMVVTDLGSRNATFVNEVRLLGSNRVVSWGDVVRFGYDSVTYRLVKELDEFPAHHDLADQDHKIPAHELPPAGRPSVADGDMNQSISSVMSPPRKNKVSSKNTFRELHQDVGHKQSHADSLSGGKKGAEFDGIGFPRDDQPPPRRERDRDVERDSDRERSDGHRQRAGPSSHDHRGRNDEGDEVP